MKFQTLFLMAVGSMACLLCIGQRTPAGYQDFLKAEIKQGRSYSDLRTLCKSVGHRLSGSPQADKAVEWARQTLEQIVPGSVQLQACTVPHWDRGRPEACVLKFPITDSIVPLSVLALGGSIGTKPEGLEAEVVQVTSFEELKKMGKAGVSGKIVFFNVVMESNLLSFVC